MAQVFVGISSTGLESDRATVIQQLQGHATRECNELVYRINFLNVPVRY